MYTFEREEIIGEKGEGGGGGLCGCLFLGVDVARQIAAAIELSILCAGPKNPTHDRSTRQARIDFSGADQA